MTIKTILGLSTTLVLLSGVFAPVSAQTTYPTRADRPTYSITRTPRLSQGVSPRVEACERVKDKLTNAITVYKQRKAQHVQNYNNAVSVMNALLDSLESKGQDVTKARADVLVLQGKLTKLEADFNAFSAKIPPAQEIVCTNPAAYKVRVQEARVALKVVQADIQDIQIYYSTVLRPEFQAFKDSVRDSLTLTPRPTRSVSGRPTGWPTNRPTRAF